MDIPTLFRRKNASGNQQKTIKANGFLYGYSINRRWLDRPIDPSLSVIRVDEVDGQPLAIVGNYACHAVVLGYDNLLISGDWPGYASRYLENDFGGDFIEKNLF